MDMIFITNTLAMQVRTILGWGIVLADTWQADTHRQTRELHIHVMGFVCVPCHEMDAVLEQFIAVGLARPAVRSEMFDPPYFDLEAARLDHP